MLAFAKFWATLLSVPMVIMLVSVTQASAQSGNAELERNLALLVSFSKATGQILQSGDHVDLVWIPHPGLDQWGVEKQIIVSLIANDLLLTALPQPVVWNETELGYTAVATILVNLSVLSEITNVHDNGDFFIVRKP